MNWTSLVPGGLPAVIGGVIAAVLAVLAVVFKRGSASGRDAEIAREAKAREKDIELVKRAAGARPSVGVRDDPNNRDRPA